MALAFHHTSGKIFSCLQRWLHVFSEHMNIDNLSEKELLNACTQGNKEAWDAIVERYTNLMKNFQKKNIEKFLKS